MQASARTTEQKTRATSRSTAREPATTSAKKLLPSRRRAAVTGVWRRVPSQMLGRPASALRGEPSRRLSSTERPRAALAPEGPLLALIRAWSAQARARASTRALLERRPSAASRCCGAARVTKALDSLLDGSPR